MSRRPLRALLAGCAVMVPLAAAVPAHAARVLNVQVPISFEETNCAGEPILITGTWHIVAKSAVIDGDEIFVSQHVNTQNTTAVNLLTGQSYVVSETLNTITHPRFDAASPTTVNAQYHVIAPGTEDNLTLQTVFHVTFNANGDVTVFHNSGHFNCQG